MSDQSRAPLDVSLGGGVNSCSMLLGMYERGIRPDLILFADTGDEIENPSEWPETYQYVEMFSRWLDQRGMPEVTVVRHATDTLYASCIRNGTLPSKAYGFPGCAVKFKHQIIERFETATYGPDVIIEKAIGYHALEDRGSDIQERGRYRYRYFLKEWGWGQDECVESFGRHGLPVPPKSACYFCPSAKPHEIRRLNREHPDLMAKAIAMEENAIPYHAERGGLVKGLGRTFSWKQVIKADEDQLKMFPEPDRVPCMCFDGGDER
jgi:hypothetical protein